MSKPKKPHRTPEDLELLKSDVASFASSLGLAPSSATSASASASAAGFDDSDFRKTGSFKPPKSRDRKPSTPEQIDGDEKKIKKDDPDSKPKPKSKPHPLQIDPFENAKDDKDLPKV
ncbi:putative CCAAT/enhancer-binding protein zeta [Cocos nucifera]|nr:putative CCAAT/enhancer-binding protein zeta [Cocos nucifera]